MASLLDRKPDLAVTQLQQAILLDRSNAGLLSDLAAAYMEKWRQRDDPLDLVLSLSNAQKSLEISPQLLEARFNLALVLQELNLRSESEAAWYNYLSLDLSSEWAIEARAYLRGGVQLTLWELWERDIGRLRGFQGHNNQGILEQMTHRYPQQMKEFVLQELLADWGDALLEQRSKKAAHLLGISQEIGRMLELITDDHMVSDVIDIINRTKGVGSIDDLAAAHVMYRQGTRLYNDFKPHAAAPILEKARKIFKQNKSPLELWAGLWLAGTEFYRLDLAHYRAIVDDIGSRRELVRYPTLQGRLLWMQGLTELVQSNLESSLDSYLASFKIFKRAGEFENAGAVEALIAENMQLLGDKRSAWRFRLQALRKLSQFPQSLRLHNALVDAAASLEISDPWAAQSFISEVVHVAGRRQKPASTAEALLWRSRLTGKTRRSRWTPEDLAQAKRLIDKIDDPAPKQRLEIEASLLECELGTSEFMDRISPLSDIIDNYRTDQFLVNLPLAYRLRAKIFISLGHLRSGEEDLVEGVELYERGLRDNKSLSLRPSYFEQAQDLYAAIVSLKAQRSEVLESFEYSERSRLGTFVAGIPDDSNINLAGLIPLSRLSDNLLPLLKKLPADLQLIEYMALDDHLMIWVVDRRGVTLRQVEVDSRHLSDLATVFVKSIEANSSKEELREISVRLYELLFSPVEDLLTPNSKLIIAPPNILARLPFGALMNREGKYVIQLHPVGVVPSATVYLLSDSMLAADAGSRDWSTLVVGNPDFDRRKFPYLEALPGAELEAAEIAKIYPDSSLLLGNEATKDRFLKEVASHEIIYYAGHALGSEGGGLSNLVFASGHHKEAESDVLHGKDLARLNLSHVELVVLSACSTSGYNDPASIAAPFLVAGVPAVVASLWKVSDEATRNMMLTLSRNLRNGTEGVVALQLAQLDQIKEGRRTSDWAGFEMIGNLMPTNQ